MGYNTAAMFLNDAIDGLKTDPNVGHRIFEAIITSDRPENRKRGFTDFPIGNYCNGGLVLPSRHADDIQVIAFGRNYAKVLGVTWHANMEEPLEVIKALADQMGYRLVKKPAR